MRVMIFTQIRKIVIGLLANGVTDYIKIRVLSEPDNSFKNKTIVFKFHPHREHN